MSATWSPELSHSRWQAIWPPSMISSSVHTVPDVRVIGLPCPKPRTKTGGWGRSRPLRVGENERRDTGDGDVAVQDGDWLGDLLRAHVIVHGDRHAVPVSPRDAGGVSSKLYHDGGHLLVGGPISLQVFVVREGNLSRRPPQAMRCRPLALPSSEGHGVLVVPPDRIQSARCTRT